jgi:hypothetical protein
MRKILLLTLGLLGLALAVSTLTLPAQAQYGTLSIGTIVAAKDPIACPGGGWFHYGPQAQYVLCFGAIVSNCPGANALNLTFGYLDPVGIVPGVTQEKGVIVLHSGQDGTSPAGDDVGISDGDSAFAGYYFGQGYVVVEVAWDSAWEATQDPFPVTTPPTYGNVQLAACRPATFFNYVFNNIYLPIYNNINPQAGMCGHGFSAGSAALAYSMAYYKPPSATPQWWWDNVELLAGPAVSDMKQGCKKPLAQSVTVCGSGQWGCPQNTASWTGPPEFVGPAAGWVGAWTNDGACANPNVQLTSPESELRWLQQSIVDDGTNNPVFSYPHTAMAGWLCRSLGNLQTTSCTTDYHWNTCPNESSEQGQIFFNNFTQSNTPPVYNLYPVDNCTGPEGVAAGTVLISATNEGGFDAISQDMAGGPLSPHGAQCQHVH